MAYKLTHPESKQEIEVEADQVSTYESQGWEEVPTPPRVSTKTPNDPKAE